MLYRIDRLSSILGVEKEILISSSNKNLYSFGFDSVDLARLRNALDPKPSFQELYGMTIKIVLERLVLSDEAGVENLFVSQLISPVLDIQQSYLIGAGLGCPCVIYQEFGIDQLNIPLFWNALDRVVLTEPMLHAVIYDDTKQMIKKRGDWSSVNHELSRVNSFDEQRRFLLERFLKGSRDWDVSISEVDGLKRLHLIVNMLFMDASSVVVLCNRVVDAYQCLLHERDWRFDVEVPWFLHYAKERAQRQPGAQVIDLWKSRLMDYPKSPQLPRKKHDEQVNAKFDRVSHCLGNQPWSVLKGLAHHKGVSSSSLLIAVFADVVRLYSENSEFTLTMTCSDRPSDSKYDGVVGEFTNVVLCPFKRSNSSPLDCAADVQRVVNFAFEQEGLTGLDTVRLLREVQKDPHIGFPIVFTSFLGITDRLHAFQDADFQLVYQQTQTPQLSLDHQVFELNGCLHINWDFDAEVHERALMQEMLACFVATLEQMVLEPSGVALLAPRVLALRDQMNATETIFKMNGDVPELLHQLILKQAHVHANKVAVIDQDLHVTYQQLVDFAMAIALELQRRGVRVQEPVAIVQEKGWEQVASTLGVLMAGAAYLPLNPSHPDDRLISILQMADCRFALVQEKTLFNQGVSRRWVGEEGRGLVETIVVDVALRPTKPFDPVVIPSSSLAYIIFTSGSTGMPKGVEIDHRGAVNTCLDINARFGLGAETVTFGISSLGFDLSVWDIFGTLGSGGTLVMCAPDKTIDPDYWWSQVLKHHVTVWNTVPTSFEMLVHSRPEHVDMPVRSVLLSGDAISINMVREAMHVFPNVQINALGGATEASIWSNYHVVSAETFTQGTDLVPYGRPLSNQTMMVLDEQLRYRPMGVVGDIYIGGVGVARGYFGAPELTAEKFIGAGVFGRVYQTGDLGRYLPNGEIEIIGRKDSQVKVGGHRVELSEIERCAEVLEGVTRAAVVHIPGAGARVVGFYTGSLDERQVQAFVEDHLPDYMAPNVWIQLENIPLTANSKVDSKQLRLLAQSQGAMGMEGRAPNGQDVQDILVLAAQVLDVPEGVLSPARSLAEQGLTSLYAVQLVNRLNRKYQTKLSYTLLFNYPTAEKLAAYLATMNQAQQPQGVVVAERKQEPIAIIATACRLPTGVSSSDEFREQLLKSVDVFSDIPTARFDIDQIYSSEVGAEGASYVRRGAFIDEVTGFDNDLFGISRAEAKFMDPQQRLMMEVAYEAIVNAGYALESLAGSDTGVFIGQMNYDWMMDFNYSKEYASTGSAPSITSNRISFAFDWHGPSMTIDTACSSSLVAVDMAVERLRKGDCSLAVAGGVNLILSPEPYVFTCQSRMLSPRQRCATFDEQADGIIRGEGVGAVLLKRLSDAQKDGDVILAVIRGCAVNQDGRSASLTAPNGLAQQALYRSALLDASVMGADLDYVECHGTGTVLGDPIEVESIKSVMSVNRKKPIVLGALKTNLGHLEGAAGIIGLLKAVEVIRHRQVPPNKHFQRLNPKINLEGFDAIIPTEIVSLPNDGVVSAGVSSFGYGGTNAHLILQSYGQSAQKMKNPNGWIFPGQGSLYSGAVFPLFQHNATFRSSLVQYLGLAESCIQASGLMASSLLDLVLGLTESKDALLKTEIQQPALVAVQLAQVAMWETRGLKPGWVVGDACGELSAAVVLGVLRPEEAIQLAAKRGELMGHDSQENMAFARDAFVESCRAYSLSEPVSDIHFVCASSKTMDPGTMTSPEYWGRQMVSKGSCVEAIKTLSDGLQGQEVLIEFGGHPTVLSFCREWLKDYPRIRFLHSVDTAKGVPSLVQFKHSTFDWPALNAKKPIVHGSNVERGFESVASFESLDYGWVTQESWQVFEPFGEKAHERLTLLSPVEFGQVPPRWDSFLIDGFSDIPSFIHGREHQPLVYVCGLGVNDVYCFLQVLQGLTQSDFQSKILVMIPSDLKGCGGLKGLCRAAEVELKLSIQVVVAPLKVCVSAIQQALRDTRDVLRFDGEHCWERVFIPLKQATHKRRMIVPNGVYVITGGLGDLGQRAVSVLYVSGARDMVLLGRKSNERVNTQLLALKARLPHANIRYFACDLADDSAVRQWSSTFGAKVKGIVHTAGELDDGLIGSQTIARFRKVMDTKVQGVCSLISHLKPSDFVVLYSSVVARLGSYGQSNYCVANAALDGLSDELTKPMVASIQWGAWAELGMAHRGNLVEKLESEGFGVVRPLEGDEILGYVLNHEVSGVISASPIDQEKRKNFSLKPPIVSMSTSIESSAWNRSRILEAVQSSLQQFVEMAIDGDMPFMEAGLSSLDLVQFRQALLKALPSSVEIPAQFVFNYPTVEDVVDHLCEQLKHEREEEKSVLAPAIPYRWQPLNDETEGSPLFLVGGVIGTIEKTFGPLAQALTVPVCGVMPDIPWDLNGQTLEGFARSLLDALRAQYPQDAYWIGGLSFGATLAIEMGLQLERDRVGSLLGVVLLDPRHMSPLTLPADPFPFERLVSMYSPKQRLVAPAYWYRSSIPVWDSQSDMMKEASRSFQSDEEMESRCKGVLDQIHERAVEGHHFNFLYRFRDSLAEQMNQDLKPFVCQDQEPIAIVSAVCRLPSGVENREQFWAMLSNKKDCIGPIPPTRFDIDSVYHPDPDRIGRSYTRVGGFIDTAEYFDHRLFGLSEAEAKVMDPQQRVLLEVVHQSFVEAGYDRQALKGSDTAVFVGLANDDWSSMGRDHEAHNPHFGAGVSGSIMSNRISYLYGLNGPSMTVDTACSSSLVAVDLAVEKLRNGRCSKAVVGGVNIIASQRMYVSACATKALSPNGRCASFDSEADGYCRGEGAGAVVLKRLSDAQKDKDTILAVIRGTAVNQDGKSVSMTAPNGIAQESVIQQALVNGQVKPSQIDYVECHGTGTPLGDPIEVASIQKVLLEDRKHPLVIGSIKSNIGHLEGAAGIVGLIKAVEVLRRRQAPGIVHFKQLNPNIDPNPNLRISGEHQSLRPTGVLTAGVSSFGFGGTNAHVVLSSYESDNLASKLNADFVDFKRQYFPWRRLPNPLLSRMIDGHIGANLTGALADLWCDHTIQNITLVPGASHITMLTGGALVSEAEASGAYSVRNIVFSNPAVLGLAEQIVCDRTSDRWIIKVGSHGSWNDVASAQRPEQRDVFRAEPMPDVLDVQNRTTEVRYQDLMSQLSDQIQFGEKYKLIDQLWVNDQEGLAKIQISGLSGIECGLSLIAPPILDAGIQLMGLCCVKTSGLCVPFAVEEAILNVLDCQPNHVWLYTKIRTADHERVSGDVYLYTEQGRCLAVLRGLTCRPWRGEHPIRNSLFEERWIVAEPIPDERPRSGVLLSSKGSDGEHALGNWKHRVFADSEQLSHFLESPHECLVWVADDDCFGLTLELLRQLNRHENSIRIAFLLPFESPRSSAISSLIRSVRQENPRLNIRCIQGTRLEILKTVQQTDVWQEEPDYRVENGVCLVARLFHAEPKLNPAICGIAPNKTYVISGGLGGLGQVAMKFLLDEGARYIVLLTRQELPKPQSDTNARVSVVCCDVRDASQVQQLGERLKLEMWPAVAGVLHTAGVLTDATISNQTMEHFNNAKAAKVEGAVYLKEYLKPSDFLILYSSAASVFGSAGQSSYAWANAQLDQLAEHWKSDECAVMSIQWGPWSETGMAVRQGAIERAHEMGYGSIDSAKGCITLKYLIEQGYRGVVCVCPMNWQRFQSSSPLFRSFLAQVVASKQTEQLVLVESAWTEEEIREGVRTAASKAMGKPVNDSMSLMANGLDSLGGVVLAQALSKTFDLTLGAIFTLNHPSIDDMVQELLRLAPKRKVEQPALAVEDLSLEEHSSARQGNKQPVDSRNEAIAIVSMACRLPGGVNSSNEFWHLLDQKTDAISEIPRTRFDIDEVYDADVNARGKSYTRKGGFMRDAEYFDYEYFGIPEIEAEAMDPHQRLMLSTGFEAFHHLGYSIRDLKGLNVGVFIGVSNQDWMVTKGEALAHNPYFGPGVSFSIMSNRISYALGLNGPSMTIDTACSSSLVALDVAVGKLRNRDCDAALVGGVNVMMHPRTFVGSCAANMLSKSGRCASFDASADGYCRGEGVGAVVLKRLSDAEAQGDTILAVIRGCAVNQDGASATMTAPNGKAQQAVLRKAYQNAGIDPRDVDYVECHGTGTPLGDPIEVDALKTVLGAGRQKPLVLGSAKSNIGHLEGAAGIVGLIKAVEVLSHRTAPGVGHFSTLNPNIDTDGFLVRISGETTELTSKGLLIAGVSSFGFGGTNAHVVLSSYDSPTPRKLVSPMPYQARFLPWRCLPNPLLSFKTKAGYGASINRELADLWKDHRLQDRVIVPAASHITMLAGHHVLTNVDELAGVLVRDIIIVQPAILDDSNAQQIRCVESESLMIELGRDSQWQRIAFAKAVTDYNQIDVFKEAPEDVMARCSKTSYHEKYESLKTLGAQFGDGYQNISDLYLGSNEGLALVEVELNSINQSLSLLAPQTLDAGIQLLSLLGQQDATLMVPFSIGEARLNHLAQQPKRLWAYAKIKEASPTFVTGDVWMFNHDGECVATLFDLLCKTWEPKHEVVDHLYHLVWSSDQTETMNLAETSGTLVSVGQQKVLDLLPSSWTSKYPTSLKQCLGGVDASCAFLMVDARGAVGLSDFMGFLKTFVPQCANVPLRLVLLEGDVHTSAAVSMVQSLLQEQAALDIQCMLVDASTTISSILQMPLPVHEPVIRWRENAWQLARLAHQTTFPERVNSIRSDASYVISGGLGALGIAAAESLVALGARHLVLIGRALKTPEQWPEAARALLSKAQVEYLSADVGDPHMLQLAWAQAKLDNPPIAGVIHTAGVLTDGIFENQTPEKLSTAVHVKVLGAQNLFELFKPSDFFVAYSSASARFGSAGQSSYAAANGMMDELIQHWVSQGIRALSIQWGAWSGDGMAQRTGAVQKSEAAGYGSISTRLGQQALTFLLNHQAQGVLCFCPFEWEKVSLSTPLVSELMAHGKPATNTKPRTLQQRPYTKEIDWSEAEIKLLVRKAVHKALGHSVRDEEPLMANGLDSLNGVALAQDIGKALGLQLGAIFTINHPSIDEMVSELKTKAPKREVIPELEPTHRIDDDVSLINEGDIAVVSVACKLPGGVDNTDDLWEMLIQKPELMREVPKQRFDLDPYFDTNPSAVGKTYTKHGSFLDEVDFFDHDFFGIPATEARAMDPQQRLLLEVSCEAFYRAGYDMTSLKSKAIGVFVGQMNHDWAHMHGDRLLHDPYFGAGSAASITSNRMSYVFGLSGPSMTLDTACSSSLVALDLAVSKLREGECNAALVGGVNLMLSHRSFIGCCAANMLSRKGRCASFDEEADGYSRGEGVGAVVLKRLSDAESDGSNILAVIKGIAVNQDGRSASLTAPNGKAQEKVIQKALAEAGYQGKDLDFVECHGTGTPLGDPIEIEALKEVTQQGREKPLVVGTIKSNIGHLEGAAGIIGFIKAVETVRRRQVPGLAHFNRLNSKISLQGTQIVIGGTASHLLGRKVIGGVSSFGFGGTNVHVVLESYGEKITEAPKPKPMLKRTEAIMMFTGQGSLQSGVLKNLFDQEPVFNQALRRYCEMLDQEGLRILEPLLTASTTNTQFLISTRIQQPALVAMQLAMLDFWSERGVKASKVLGHSIGEFAASVAAGVMSAHDALHLSIVRGQSMDECEPGSMAALMIPRSELIPLPLGIVCAAENGPNLTVLAGPTHQLTVWLSQNYPSQFVELPVSHAFHSPMMEPAKHKLMHCLESKKLDAPTEVQFFSTLSGRQETTALTKLAYWGEQMIQTVSFRQAVQSLFEVSGNESIVLELGPGNTLIKMAQRISANQGLQWIDTVNQLGMPL